MDFSFQSPPAAKGPAVALLFLPSASSSPPNVQYLSILFQRDFFLWEKLITLLPMVTTVVE
jgi:hypothetical protein